VIVEGLAVLEDLLVEDVGAAVADLDSPVRTLVVQ